jgi:hypothetical protein
MANGRSAGRIKGDAGRESGGFVALPWSVLDSAAYARLSHPAKALLFELARQFVRDNNGRLLASRAYLARRGWKSSDVIDRAKRQLIDAGFIVEMVKGHRPNKASWFAVTWRALDRHPAYDSWAVAAFERGAYRKGDQLKNASLSPSPGPVRPSIGPPNGLERPLPSPPAGTVTAAKLVSLSPPAGHHLEMPSDAATQTQH